MAEATPEQRWTDTQGHLFCGVARPLQDYIERVLVDNGLVNIESGALRMERIVQRVGANAEPEML